MNKVKTHTKPYRSSDILDHEMREFSTGDIFTLAGSETGIWTGTNGCMKLHVWILWHYTIARTEADTYCPLLFWSRFRFLFLSWCRFRSVWISYEGKSTEVFISSDIDSVHRNNNKSEIDLTHSHDCINWLVSTALLPKLLQGSVFSCVSLSVSPWGGGVPCDP